ncbi:MAG: MBL fold metallo-hydrolase [Gemmatimonadaceae bacterium]
MHRSGRSSSLERPAKLPGPATFCGSPARPSCSTAACSREGVTRHGTRSYSFPFPVAEIDAIVLSHAHIDHSGRLPLLTAKGYRGPPSAPAPRATSAP